MRRRAWILVVCGAVVCGALACGGTVSEGNPAGADAEGSSTTTGTGGSTTTGAGGAGGADACGSPESRACWGPGECVLATENCCLCGTPEISDFVAVNAAHQSDCRCSGPMCQCATEPNPNLAASCEQGQCVGWDVRQVDAYSACTADADCRLRAGLTCCEPCDAQTWELVAIRTDAAQLLAQAMCTLSQTCAACVPQYPAQIVAACIQGHCAAVPIAFP